ncbi:hypothetical protein [Chitinimonas naiadis]
MRAHPIDSSQALPTSTPQAEPKPLGQAPPGFEAWYAQALAVSSLRPDPELESGPADFGLWGASPDSNGRLELDEVAGNLRATLPTFAANLGRICRGAGIVTPPLLRLEAGSDIQPALPFDVRATAVQQLFDDSPGLARQFRRLMAGFGFVRCSDALRAYQRAIARVGPSRLAAIMARQGDAHASPHLALVFDGSAAWPEEAAGERWRPLAGLEQLSRELMDSAMAPLPKAAEKSLPIDQVFDPIGARLRAARQR